MTISIFLVEVSVMSKIKQKIHSTYWEYKVLLMNSFPGCDLPKNGQLWFPRKNKTKKHNSGIT